MVKQTGKYSPKEKHLLLRLKPYEQDVVKSLKKKQKTQIFDSLAHESKHTYFDIPLRIQLLQKDMDPDLKMKLFYTLAVNETPKYTQYVVDVLQLPFGVYKKPNTVIASLTMNKFLVHARSVMDFNVTGNDSAKNEVLKLLCGWKKSGSLSSHAISFQGKPGVGKTHFVKTAFAQAMDLPVAFISLGGCTDSTYLMGTLYPYEGSTYGRLANALIECQCENPIIFFDELDKISQTPKGSEIINSLIHVIDPIQNKHVRDNYFGFDIDFSKCTFVFSYNDENAISPILLDRMKQIKFETPNLDQRIMIVKKHILPRIKTKLHSEINMSDESIRYIVDREKDSGMRNIEKDIEHSILFAEIVQECKDGGKVIGFENLEITSSGIDIGEISKILPQDACKQNLMVHMYM